MTEKTQLEVDDVVYEYSYGKICGKYVIGRVTKTMAFVRNRENIRFKRGCTSYISLVSTDRWSGLSYRIETTEIKKEYDLFVMNHTIKRTDWTKLSESKIKQIYQIICAKESE